MYSGVAFSPTISNAPLANADFNAFRPDIIGDPHLSSPSANLWFNPAAYTAPQAPYRDGDASKGSLRGPALFVFNGCSPLGRSRFFLASCCFLTGFATRGQ